MNAAAILLISVIAGTVAIPPPSDEEVMYDILPGDDVPPEQNLPEAINLLDVLVRYLSHDEAAPASTQFKHLYVSQRGYGKVKQSNTIDVTATTGVSDAIHAKAARLVMLMSRNMPSSFFKTISSRGRVGIFTRAEGTTVYSEYARYKDKPECKGTCSGTNCRSTCTSDGRKYQTIGGLGGIRATAVAENVACSSRDPYRKNFNVLVHEFAHTVHQYGLDTSTKSRITQAYKNAKNKCTWQCRSYGMGNHLEYFAEGTTAWFMASKQSSSGGMNRCTSSAYCTNEMSAREHLKRKDFELYQVLNYVWNNNRSTIPSGIKGPCSW